MDKARLIALAEKHGGSVLRHPGYDPLVQFDLTDLEAFAAALIAEHAAPGVVKWQPIETAPKDAVFINGNHFYGTTILVFAADEVIRARWWHHKDGSSNFIQDGDRACFPTHWAPLPTPPRGQS